MRLKMPAIKAPNFNMMMARSHRLAGHMTGLQLTYGKFFCISLSALQLSGGFIIVGQPIVKTNPALYYPMFALLGVVMALIIEALSISGLSYVRIASAERKAIEGAYRLLSAPTEADEAACKRQLNETKTKKKVGLGIAALGMVMSMALGDIFWHNLFNPLQPDWYAQLLGAATAALIGVSFVNSEVFKPLIDSVVKSIMNDNSVVALAVSIEEENMQFDVQMQTYDKVREDADALEGVQEKLMGGIVRRFGNFAKQSSQVNDMRQAYSQQNLIGGTPVPQLALPAPRGKYAQHRDELIRLLSTNPGMSQGDIARHFGISKSTANAWLSKTQTGALPVRPGKQATKVAPVIETSIVLLDACGNPINSPKVR